MVAWIAVLAALGLWSVRHDPPTVPEQRNIAQALPVLERATGAVLAAAQGPGRAVLLGDLRLDRGCRLTPLRAGVAATRDVTVYVTADQARGALEAIARGLPAGYRAHVTHGGVVPGGGAQGGVAQGGGAQGGVAQGGRGTRVSLHADAGAYVAIDADTLANAQVLTVEASTGCRPPAGTPLATDPPAGDPPPALTAVLRALNGSGVPAVTAVACPAGGIAATFTVDGLPPIADLGRSLEPVTAGATVVRSSPGGWAYRTGTDSVVVTAESTSVAVATTTPCP